MFGWKNKKIKELEAINSAITAEHEALSKNLNDTILIAKNLKNDCARLRLENAALKTHIAEIQKSLNSARSVNTMLKNKNAKLQKANKKLSEEYKLVEPKEK